MLMIVNLHFLGKGGVLGAVVPSSPGYYIVWLFEGLSIVAVNCYVLISGYFQVKSTFKMKNLLSLVTQVTFYTVFIYAIMLATGRVEFNLPSLVGALLPVFANDYWFITAYVGMYILSPFMNQFIAILNREQHKKIIFVLAALFSVWPSLFMQYWQTNAIGDAGYGMASGYSVMWFLVLYISAAYVRLYYKPDYRLKKHIVHYLALALVVPICIYIAGNLSVILNDTNLIAYNNLFLSYNFLPTYLTSIALFVVFLNISISNQLINRFIALLSPLALGVYLIHENPYIRSLLWESLQVSSRLTHLKFPLYAVVIIFAIYITCTAIDWLRLKLFNAIQKTSSFKSFYATLENYAKTWFAKLLKLQ